MTRIASCGVCASTDHESVLSRRFEISFMEGLPVFEYARCEDCGFVFVRDPLDEERAEAYYNSSFRWGHVYETPPPSARAIWESQAAFLSGAIPPGGRVLEIGSGPGYFLRLLLDTGLAGKAVGHEMSPRALEYGRNVLGLDMTDAGTVSLEEITAAGPYDLVVLRHVLEHIPAPDRYLAGLLPLLGRSGRLFVETPCLDVLDARAQAFPVFEHVNYFSQAQMAHLLGRLGLTLLAEGRDVYSPDSEKPYRVLRALAQAGGRTSAAPAPRSPLTARDFQEFSARSDVLGAAEKAVLDALASDPGPDTVYAFHAASNETLALLRRTGLAEKRPVAAIFDSNTGKWGQTIEGVPVMSPEQMKEIRPQRIIIGSSAFRREIGEGLRAAGVEESRILDPWEPIP